MKVTEDEKKKYSGEYRFGDGDRELFLVDVTGLVHYKSVVKVISGRKLNKVDENTFSPAGAASVKIIFKIKDDKAVSFSVHEPEPLVNAVRI